jgi:uncharacterized Zn-finger protein
LAYFCAFVEIAVSKRAHESERFMIPDQAKGKQDDAASKLSTNIIVTNHLRVACNGGGGTLGHPQIFLTLGNDGKVTCPYCSREFVKSAD